MTLEALGYDDVLAQYRKEHGLEAFGVGRVTEEHKERYVVKTEQAELQAELIGNLRFTAESRKDFPAVGDWVAISQYDEDKALIHAILPRKSIIERKAVGKQGNEQLIATNIDFGLIVQAVDRDFNLNRLERYLTICHASKVDPIIILNKVDLINEEALQELLSGLQNRIQHLPILSLSSEIQESYQALEQLIQPGKTYCLLGSSGVGKSTLLNRLTGQEVMKTGAISDQVNKGKHTTSHRELIVLPKGGIMIDNPGLREVGLADTAQGLEITFDVILGLAERCKYKDCQHLNESGCAVIAAVEAGEIEEEAYQNYLKLEREKQHYEASVHEKRKKDKVFGKLIKEVVKNRKHTKG